MTGFDTTRWSLVLRAQSSGGDAFTALEVLCRTYRPPVLAYIRSRGHNHDVAEDLTQSFFAQFLERAGHADADPARGRFRAFLLTAIKRFLINVSIEAHTAKRGGRIRFESIDCHPHEADNVPASGENPEQAFERSWALVVLDTAMHRLRDEARTAHKDELFDQLRAFLIESPDEADYARVAAALNLRRNTIAVAVHRLRHRLRELVHEELAQTAADREGFEAELRELRSALGAGMD